jgi:glucose-fructose oxidoreductase
MVDGKKSTKKVPKRDQFAAKLLYFSDCILNNRKPEPSGEEGLQDVRIVEALYRSAKTGRAVKIHAFENRHREGSVRKIRRDQQFTDKSEDRRRSVDAPQGPRDD